MRTHGITIAIAGVALTLFASMPAGQDMPHQDTREAIKLPAMQRNMVLAEMRGMLTSVNGILRGLATGDTALTRASAAAAGMAAMMGGGGMGMGRGMGAGRGRGMGPMMPEGFRSLGHATHQSFDSLAARISQGAPADTVVARLAAITNNCLVCHSTYRLEALP